MTRHEIEEFWRRNAAVETAVDKFIVYVSDKEGTDSASDFEDCSNRHGF
jgi:hypothetical protein